MGGIRANLKVGIVTLKETSQSTSWCVFLSQSARQVQAWSKQTVGFHQGYGLVISPGNFKSRTKRFVVE